MTNKELAKKLIDVAKNYKTLYVMGCFGAPMTETNKIRYIKENSYNAEVMRKAMINAATPDTFGFDCVCLIKGILWGWNGNKAHVYGGANYISNGVPDIGADGIIDVCKEVSTNFNDIEVGELVWMPGHVGVYVGDGLCIECTPAWGNCVQLTSCNKTIVGYNRRNWVKHGKLPYVTYEKENKVESKKKLESGNDIVWELMNGKHKIKIDDVKRAVNALDNAKNSKDFMSLYWILYKLVNGND